MDKGQFNICSFGKIQKHKNKTKDISENNNKNLEKLIYLAWFIAKYIDRQGISESQERGLPDQVWKHISI